MYLSHTLENILTQIWLDKLNLTKAVSPTNKHPFRNLDKDAANVKDTNLINVKSSMGTLKGAAVKNIVLTHTINLPHNTLTPQNTLSSNLIHKSFNNAIIHTPLLNKNTSPLVIKTSTHAKTTSQINPSIPSFVPASDVCNDSSLTCQLLNKSMCFCVLLLLEVCLGLEVDWCLCLSSVYGECLNSVNMQAIFYTLRLFVLSYKTFYSLYFEILFITLHFSNLFQELYILMIFYQMFHTNILLEGQQTQSIYF